MSGEPLVVIPHPLADNHPEEVVRKATAVVDEVISVLTEPAASLAERYRGRFTKLTERRLDGAAPCLDEVCVVDVDRGIQRR
jgi:hypothetical protein